MKHKTLTKIPENLKNCVDKKKKHDIMATVVSQADVAELVYAHDSGSCEHCARAGSSPAICTRRREFEHGKTCSPLFQEGGGRGGQIFKIKAF